MSALPAASMRLHPQARSQSISEGERQSKLDGVGDDEEADEAAGPSERPRDVLWEVGSVSDESDEEGKEGGRGVGGAKEGRGEQRGLLVEEDGLEEDGDGEGVSGPARRPAEGGDPFSDQGENGDEGFGEYEGVQSGLPRSANTDRRK